ncbi:nuclear transport factor 2 family protein [Microbacterium aoyamense]|nr:nuclear transport factor 2 family protein [Microbacterium aoyamense]
MYQAERDRDIDAWVALWDKRGCFTYPALGDEATVRGIDELKAATLEKFRVRPAYEIEHQLELLGDASRVLSRLTLTFPGERSFPVWCVFSMTEDNLILEVAELFDSGRIPGSVPLSRR